MLKRLKSVFLCAALICSTLAGCGYEYSDIELDREYTKKFSGSELNVYNWGEYISDGSDDMLDVNREFERLTGIHVNYTTFESNESMYSQLKSGGVSYDIIVPSDYMIERLKNEGELKKIDVSKLHNYPYIPHFQTHLFEAELQISYYQTYRDSTRCPAHLCQGLH